MYIDTNHTNGNNESNGKSIDLNLTSGPSPTEYNSLMAIPNAPRYTPPQVFDEHHVRFLYKCLSHHGLGMSQVHCKNIADNEIVDRRMVRTEEQFLEWAREFNGKGNCFVGRNPRNEDGTLAAITSFTLDIDPVRPKDTASTDEQHLVALNAGRKIIDHFQTGYLSSSGNGALVIFVFEPVYPGDEDLEVFNRQCHDFLEECRNLLKDIDGIRVDSTYNSTGLIKILGTISTKGVRPSWRVSRFLPYPKLPIKKSPAILKIIQSFQVSTSSQPNPPSQPASNVEDRSLADFKLVLGYKNRGCSSDEALLLLSLESHRPDRIDDHCRIIKKIYENDTNSNSGSGQTANENNRAKKQNDNDQFNPKIVGDMMLNQQPFISSPISKKDGKGSQLLAFKDGKYIDDGAKVLSDLLVPQLGARFREERITNVTDYLKRVTAKYWDDLNKDACDLINVENGMLDWRSGELHEHAPSHLSTFQIHAKYDPTAVCPDVDKFLSEVLPSDVLPLVEEFMGVLMIPETKYEKAVILLGDGRNGKSTFTKVVANFIGAENVSHVSLQKLSTEKFLLGGLKGKLVNIDFDLPKTALKETDIFKKAVSGETLIGEDKFCPPFEFQPYARLLFCTNQLPRSEDRTEAFFRRWIIIPFPNKFVIGKNCNPNSIVQSKTADPDLLNRLTTPEARSYLLNLALAGLRRLTAQKAFTEPNSVIEANKEYRKYCDHLLEYFDEKLEFFLDSRLSKTEVYDDYKRWCADRGLRNPITRTNLNNAIKDFFQVDHVNTGGWHWKNLQWKVDAV